MRDSPIDLDDLPPPSAPPRPPSARARRVMAVLWPAFLGAGALCGVVFSLIDPHDVSFAGRSLEWSRMGVYTMGFFLFWIVCAAAAWWTAVLLDDPPRE